MTTQLTDSTDFIQDQACDFPPRVEIEVTVDSGSNAAEDQKWAAIIRQAAESAARIALQKRASITEDNIAALVDMYIDREAIAGISDELELDNAELRANYLKTVVTYDSAQVHKLSGLKSTNVSATASRWKNEQRIFAIRYKGTDRFPAFQFEDGKPKKLIKAILKKLPSDLSAWQTAFWFESVNGWLDGKTPAQSLVNSGAVLQAAEQAGSPAHG